VISPLVGSDRYFDKNHQPLLFKYGKGYKVFDQNDKDYIDFILGLGPVILGHNDPEFIDRMTNGLRMGLSFPGFAEIHTQLSDIYEQAYPEHKVVSLFKTSG
jgi:glutamate-1-semialdehyde 2,1-aminomutase